MALVWWLLHRNQLQKRREALTWCLLMVCITSIHDYLFFFSLLNCWGELTFPSTFQEPMHKTILLVPFLNLLCLESLLSQCQQLILTLEWTCGMHLLVALKLQKWDIINLVPRELPLVINGYKYESSSCFLKKLFLACFALCDDYFTSLCVITYTNIF